ncbi:MAG: MFS transporter [Acetobacteraceae bacterium]|nr:MFS transporter [Acetobacteraceae bacterium]
MKIPHLRWWIAGLLALASGLSYMDRQTLPVVIGEIQKVIPVSDQEYARLSLLFLLAYGIMYAGGGKLMDVLGTRWGYALMLSWWSLATFMQGTVSSVFGLSAARFMLGMGEGGGFPGSAKAVSEWFPAKERSFAFGIFNTGSSLGAILAPPLIALIVLNSTWRWVFFIAGGLGFVWVVGWLFLYNIPSRHKLLTTEEGDYLKAEINEQPDAVRVSWLGLFRIRQVWGLLIAKLLSDSAWYFYIFWLPKYLGDVRHLDIKQIGYYAWIPYVGAGIGSFIGGWLSAYLIRRNLSIDTSRKIALGISAACMPVALLIAASPLSIAILFFSMAMFGHQFWSTIVQTLAADMFPPRTVGSVAGLMGAVGSFGGVLFSLLTGWLLTAYGSYVPLFAIAGVMHPLAFVIILLVVRKVEMVIPAEGEKIPALV